MLQAGGDPQAYAEGILKICELYLASPLACVAGPTGANLQRRILAILSRRIAPGLTFGRKVLLAAAGTAALVAPFVIGIVSTRPVRAQSSAAAAPKFGVASVKPSDPRSYGMTVSGDPSRFAIHNVTIRFLISVAYDVKDFRIPAGPHWLDSYRYDIEATYGASGTTRSSDIYDDTIRLTSSFDASGPAGGPLPSCDPARDEGTPGVLIESRKEWPKAKGVNNA